MRDRIAAALRAVSEHLAHAPQERRDRLLHEASRVLREALHEVDRPEAALVTLGADLAVLVGDYEPDSAETLAAWWVWEQGPDPDEVARLPDRVTPDEPWGPSGATPGHVERHPEAEGYPQADEAPPTWQHDGADGLIVHWGYRDGAEYVCCEGHVPPEVLRAARVVMGVAHD